MFKKRKEYHGTSPVEQAEKNYNSARYWVAARAIISLLSFFAVLFTEFDLFVTLPSSLVILGKALCGMYPPKYYSIFSFSEAPARTLYDGFSDMYVFYLLITASVIFLVLHFLSWLLSKKRIGWMNCALVLTIIELIASIVMLGLSGEDISDHTATVILPILWLYFISNAIHSYKITKPYLSKTKDESTTITTE